MFGTVEIPVWLFVLILLFAAVTAASHLFIPPVRWFLRRRMERAVARLNERLERPIQPFKLARRHDMILRLIYDPAVIEAVSEHASATGMREDVAFSEAKRYAREIVPSFSATAYFGFATRAARWVSTQLYDVRLTGGGEDLARIPHDATVVFVMNHRSNMDYVLVTYLAADRSALAYAVGEWARVRPVSWLLRAMGAYFIRRRSRNPLYRRVLARYVQLAVAGGVTQAIFPEGRLSVDGSVGAAKLGLLSYIAEGGRKGDRPVVFVPVALSYDKVIEDRILIEAAQSGERRYKGSFATGTAFVLRWLWRRLTGQARSFGIAGVAFGTPVPLSDFPLRNDADIARLGQHLMAAIRRRVPLLPVPMLSEALLSGATTRQEAEACFHSRREALSGAGHDVLLVADDPGRTIDAALDMLALRRMISVSPAGRISVRDNARPLLEFYAESVTTALNELDNPASRRDRNIITEKGA
ncbi:glycerol-3-phosphate acyltransferase [Palleronia aestuarii]|uniref:Glycerol-3-phosphate acyltransferase n=1 Tax=Palleronia aestuarii TaxID=568105 RepID=A0A2W7NJW4_9RHOB|nr:1-acyl-sn-glycerol-3-phosphate acyltransferase [Palleronia aestuarii]PZX18367.1 glycerol-3-phosphate acyltransferase [Palleronia aestuarii]